MMFLALWTFFVPAPPAPNVDLSQQMERTVLAAAAQDQGAELVW
ncbi:MAG TPA: hypothetical protein VHH88_10395 [Verrucomicrobiae bacterium]|nr:hypothetical protein [Verrucomicrobiae bacterium]